MLFMILIMLASLLDAKEIWKALHLILNFAFYLLQETSLRSNRPLQNAQNKVHIFINVKINALGVL